MEQLIERDNKAPVELDYIDGFDGTQFVNHILRKYGNGKDELLTVFTARMIEHVIDYGKEHHNNSLNQFAFYLYDLIPEAEFSEVVAYCADEILTTNARNEKSDYWDSTEGEL